MVNFTPDAYILCPECGREIPTPIDNRITLENWHFDCYDEENNERLKIAALERSRINQEFDYIEWTESRNGGTHGFMGSMVLIVKQNKKGWSSGAYYQDWAGGGEALSWKRGYKTEESAQAAIAKRSKSKQMQEIGNDNGE